MSEWIESPRLVCLGFDWSVRTGDPTLLRRVTSLYEPCIASGRARHRFTLRLQETSGTPRLTLARDGRVVLRDVSPGLAMARLAWEVNRGAVENTPDRLLLHAAAAERDGEVVVLSGPRGSGKSTLVAALVRAGLRYLTDETVAVDPATTTIAAYPKPITLERGSWPLLPDLDPGAESTLGATDEWLVAPRSIRPDAVSRSGGLAALILFPAYQPGRGQGVREISRAQAAVALAEHSFNFRTFGRGALDVVADVVRSSRCYRLDVDDLEATCGLILDLLEPARVRS